MTVEAPGFLKTVRKDVAVLSGQDNESNFKINVGSANESVEVVAGADVSADYDFHPQQQLQREGRS